MTAYTIEWTPDAEADLADRWLAASDRSAVTAAAQWLETKLGSDPLRFGQPWWSSIHRIAVRGPIGVEFEVIEDDKRVIVHGVFAVP